MIKKVIIDCDPGIDDALAIMLALNSPEIEVLGITTVVGNVPVEVGTKNVLKILKQMNRLDIPVYAGCDQPLRREYRSAESIHGKDGLGDSGLDEVTGIDVSSDAISFLNQTLADNDEVTVIAIGPMTNVAFAMMSNLDVWQKAKIISMGGAYRVRGNMSPVAEFNYWCDPDSARYVYRHAYNPVVMVGLDVTRQVVFTPNMVEFVKQAQGENAAFLEKIMSFYFDFHWQQEQIIGAIINDPLAVGYLLAPDLFTTITGETDIALDGICEGQTVVDTMSEETNSIITVDIEVERFLALLLERTFKLDKALVDKVLPTL